MKDVVIASVSIEAPAGAELQTETITLNFAEVRTEYTPQKADGSGEPVIEVAWNIAQNVRV